jgi:uncharacterized protein
LSGVIDGPFLFLLYNFLPVKLGLKLGLFVAVAASCLLAEPISSLRPSNYVNDFAGVLSPTTKAQLNALCQQVEQKARAQMAVVTVKSLDGQDPVSYAVDLYQKWGIGKKGTDRGVLILLATQDRKYWTSVGYGLEPILPDGKVGGFGREMIPFLREGDYNGAVTLITNRVADVIAKDAGVTLDGVQLPSAPRGPPQSGGGAGIVGLIVLVVFVLIIWSLIRGGGGSRGSGGGGGSGFWTGMLLGTLLNSGRGGGYGGYGGGGWGGGGFGGGGGGFGGFGGGSTGGGGAGGSW